MNRRRFVAALTGLGLAPLECVAAAAEQEGDGPLSIAAAWRDARRADSAQHVGVLDIDWERGAVDIRHAVALPGRAHGLLAEPDGTLLVVAMRPGRWLLRLAGRDIAQRVDLDTEPRRLDGHVVASADGAWLYTTETDMANGRGLVGVRDGRTLRKVDEWPTHGIDPHQLLLDADGHLVIANGGIPRGADGEKRDLDRMTSSLVRLDRRDGRLLGQWRLDDPRLSLRHLAWSEGGERRLLGVALQAEHDDANERREAPVLALFDGSRLATPTHAAAAGGYAGDIAPAADGGFVLSGQRAHRAVLWQPGRAADLLPIAEVQEPCALAVRDGAVMVAAAHGVGRWHPRRPGAMLRWPEPIAVDNHWVVL